MNAFDAICTRFAQAESGSDSFKQFYKDVFELMKTDTDNAGLYFVVGIAAQTYVIKYEDQAVDPAFADSAKAKLQSLNTRLLHALAQPSDVRLRVLGQVATEYQWEVDAF